MEQFQTPSPVHKLCEIQGVQIFIKRDDEIHPQVSGNKWRKLKYHLQEFYDSQKEVLLTFGGAYSNHLAATAAVGKLENIPTKALVRGHEVENNPTLDFCRACGMEIEPISRKRYATKDDPEFVEMMRKTLPEVYIIPEGGKSPLGVQGCTEIMQEVEPSFDIICAPVGTGTTMAGLLLSGYDAQFWGFPALKGGHFLKRAIAQQIAAFQEVFSTPKAGKKLLAQRLLMVNDYHFSGYGKVNDELVAFMNHFYEQYELKLDPVYTGKMMYGLVDQIEKGAIEPGKSVLALHTGGLQGIKGMNERLQKVEKTPITYEN